MSQSSRSEPIEEGRAPRESISSGIVNQIVSEIVEAAVRADESSTLSDQEGVSTASIPSIRKQRYTR